MKPHKDVLNKQLSTLIIGYGVVGQHLHKIFTDADWVDEDAMIHGEGRKWELGFICVPTPAKGTGQCDMFFVEDAYNTWKDKVKYFCCRSTIEIGSCDRFERFCFSPERIGETKYHLESADFVILGGPKEVTKVFAEAWTLVTNADFRIYQTDGKTAELVKLMENAYLATKICFANQFYDLAEEIGVDYNELRELWLADDRIVTKNHTYVYRNNRGYAGKCLPKDIRNLVYSFNRIPFMEFIQRYNEELRCLKDDV